MSTFTKAFKETITIEKPSNSELEMLGTFLGVCTLILCITTIVSTIVFLIVTL